MMRRFLRKYKAVPAVCLGLVLCGCMESGATTNVIYNVATREQTGPVIAAEEKTPEVIAEISSTDGAALTGAPDNMESPETEAVTETIGETSAETPAETAALQEETPTGSESGADPEETDGSSSGEIRTKNGYSDKAEIGLSDEWKYAEYAAIDSGRAIMYTADSNRKDKIVAVNAGHGTKGGTSVKTLCHPDGTPKVTGGTTAAGATEAVAVSSGMTFKDGTPEAEVTLKMAHILKDKLLDAGYDVLMLRDGEDVQLDNVARTVIANNTADIHIALHWDGDGLDTIKGVFYMSVPDGLKSMEPVAAYWQQHEALGDALIEGLKGQGMKVWGSNPLDMDLTQTSYSTIPSVDIELGNQCSDHSDETLNAEAEGLLNGINSFFGF